MVVALNNSNSRKMNNKEFSKQIEERTKRFAVEIVKISATLPESSEMRVLRAQITKSGTSIGANYREANRSRSKADFANKIRICEGEASETVFWLEVLANTIKGNTDSINSLAKESTELLAIFTSISNSLRK